jgi:hypothetical protein
MTEHVEGRADTLGSVRPRIVMVQHIDQNDTKGPNIGRSGLVCWGTVVPTLKAHVRSTSTVHVRTLCFRGGKAKIRQLDDNTTLSVDETVCNDEIFRFDVTVIDALLVTRGNGIAHLGKHARNEPQPSRAEELGRMKGSEKGRSWRSPRGRGREIL